MDRDARYRGGTEEVLARLLRARADLNEQIKQSSTSLLGINWPGLRNMWFLLSVWCLNSATP